MDTRNGIIAPPTEFEQMIEKWRKFEGIEPDYLFIMKGD